MEYKELIMVILALVIIYSVAIFYLFIRVSNLGNDIKKLLNT